MNTSFSVFQAKTKFSLEEDFVSTELGSQLKISRSNRIFYLKLFYGFDF